MFIEYRKQIHELHPYPGIREMLAELKRQGLGMALISSNNKRNVLDFLARHQLNEFEWVEGTSGVMNKRKRINPIIMPILCLSFPYPSSISSQSSNWIEIVER